VGDSIGPVEIFGYMICIDPFVHRTNPVF
jgi:hypothetical protein